MIDLELLEDRIVSTWAKYQHALTRMADAKAIETQVKKDFDERKNYLISKGVEGSNAEIRKANLERELAHETEILEGAQKEIHAANLYLDIQSAEVSELRMILKLAELQHCGPADE